jgi:2-amino-4-hydroxy-6-hydroxymethyldihydropteridine diphosphokinase
MTLNGWEKKYQKILNEFDYDRSKEIRSANILNSLLKTRLGLNRLEKKIKNKTVFIIGAGPSLGISLPYIKKFKNFTKIVADGVTQALIENKIRPDIVVTDLDGISQKSVRSQISNDCTCTWRQH